MKKLTLEFDDLQAWFTIGISSQLPDYKLLFRINKALQVKFIRVDDFAVNLPKMKGIFSLYAHYDVVNKIDFFLLSNRNEGKVLLSEFKQLDYFFIIKDETGSDLIDEYKSKIKTIEEVMFTQIIDIESAKNYPIVAEGFEMHLDEIDDWREVKN
jgi:hypothetical protein